MFVNKPIVKISAKIAPNGQAPLMKELITTQMEAPSGFSLEKYEEEEENKELDNL